MTDPEAPAGAPIPKYELIAKCPMGAPLVSMIVFEGNLYVATSEAVFKKVGDEFQEQKFTVLPPEPKS